MPPSTVPIDYTNLGYEAFRDAMLALARQRMPEWTDFSENDLGVLLVELFAYANDIVSYYQTRIASNLLPGSADEPDAIVRLLRLIGYEVHPPTPATVDLRISFESSVSLPVTIPRGTQFSVKSSADAELIFEAVRDVIVDDKHLTPTDSEGLRHFSFVPLIEGESVSEIAGIADGTPNQILVLLRKPVIVGSVSVSVAEQPGLETHWKEVETLAYSSPADRHFVVQRDTAGGATLVFGDGINGLPPPAGSPSKPVTVSVTYRVGGGPQGNIPAGSEFQAKGALPPRSVRISKATNPQPAAGGTAAEDIIRAQRLAPNLFRTQQRAVTVEDYNNLALQVPGVGKALAVAVSWNEVALYISPSGRISQPSESLKRDLMAFLDTRRMATTTLRLMGPSPAYIYLKAIIRAQPYFRQADIESAAQAAVAEYLAFDNVDFGQQIYLSRIYDAIQSLPQVISLTVTEFSLDRAEELKHTEAGVEPTGIITLQPHELPQAGYSVAIKCDVKGGVP